MSIKKKKILRITTVAGTMNVILKGQLAYLNQSFEVIGATSPFYDYFDEIVSREGIRLYSVDLTRKITPFRDLKALFKLIYIILKEKPDIVHTQTPKANLIGILAAFLCMKKVRMLSIVGMPVYNQNNIKGKLLRFLDILSYRMATNIYPNSKGLMEHYKNMPAARRKIGFIGNGSSNGIDFNYFDPKSISSEILNEKKKETNINENHFVFTFMGRVVNDKGIKELIDAFLNFCDKTEFDNARLLIIGPLRDSDDPIPKTYQNFLESHPKIIHVGLQRDVRPYLLLSKVFVFPSYREGLPGALIQAGAMGIPMIASDIIGNQEIIEQTSGILFPVKNADALANVMKDIYTNAVKRESMCKDVRQKMKNLYDQQYYWQSLKEEYEKLLFNKPEKNKFEISINK